MTSSTHRAVAFIPEAGVWARLPQWRRSRSASAMTLVSALARWYAAWNEHDVEAISALMTDDVRYEDPSAPSAVMHGRAAVERYIRSAFAGVPDLHLEKLEEWVTTGGEVISSYFRF